MLPGVDLDEHRQASARSLILASSKARNMSALLSNWKYTTPSKAGFLGIASSEALA